MRAHRHQVFLLLDHDLADCDLCGLVHRIVQETERLLSPLVRREVVGLLVVDWIDLLEVGERGDVDGPRRVQRHAVQFLVADGNELALRILVTADHVVPVHNLLVLRAVAFVLDRGHAAAVQEPEPYILPFRGGVELYRDRDQSKREVSLPDWTHRAVPPSRCQRSRIDVRVLYSPLYCLPICIVCLYGTAFTRPGRRGGEEAQETAPNSTD